MTRRLFLLLLAVALLVAGCSSDPTTSEEYEALEQELATAEQQLAATEVELAEVTAERDSLAAEATQMHGGEADATLPAEAVDVIDAYVATLVAADGEAMLDYVTDDFTFLSYGTDVQERDFRASYVTANYSDFGVETMGETMVLGDGETIIVAVAERATTPMAAEGFSTMRLVKVDGSWLIDTHRFTGE